jgi:nitroreductase
VEALDAIFARRDVRQYTDDPIPRDDLERILEAGRRSPSSINRQRWDFVVVTGRSGLEKLAKVWERGGRHVASSAATIALVTPAADDADTWADIAFDVGQAAENLMIAAAGLGIGSGHSSVMDQELCRELLGYPEDHRCDYLITLGYPADRAVAPLRNHDRRPFDDVVHWDQW